MNWLASETVTIYPIPMNDAQVLSDFIFTSRMVLMVVVAIVGTTLAILLPFLFIVMSRLRKVQLAQEAAREKQEAILRLLEAVNDREYRRECLEVEQAGERLEKLSTK